MANSEDATIIREWLVKNWDRYLAIHPVPPGLDRDFAINVVLNSLLGDAELVRYVRMLVELGGREKMLFCTKCLAAMEAEGTAGLPFHTESEEEFFQHLLLVHDLTVTGKKDDGYEVEPAPKVPTI